MSWPGDCCTCCSYLGGCVAVAVAVAAAVAVTVLVTASVVADDGAAEMAGVLVVVV